MALIFRPTTRGGTSVIDRARQMAAKYAGSTGVWYDVVNGYILRALGFGGPNVTVQVIDQPVLVATFGWRSFGPGSWPFVYAVTIPNRDVFLPAALDAESPELSPEVYPITVAEDSMKWYATAVMFIPSTGVFGGHVVEVSSAVSSGQWAGCGALVRNTPEIESTTVYQASLMLVNGSTQTGGRYEEIEVGPSLALQQVYVWDDTLLQSRFGQPLTMGWAGAPWSWQVAASIRPELYPLVSAATAPKRIAVACGVSSVPNPQSAHAGVVSFAIDPWPEALPPNNYIIQFFYIRLRLIKDLGIPELVATVRTNGTVEPNYVTGLGSVIGATGNQRILFTAYAEQRDDSGPSVVTRMATYVIAMEQPSQSYTVLHSIVWANDTTSADAYGIPYQPDLTFTGALGQCSAQVVVDDEVELVSYLPYNRFVGKKVAGKTYPYISHVDTDLVLMRDDGAHIVTGLRAAGLSVALGEYNFSTGIWGVGGYAPTVLADMGNNRLAVIVVGDQLSTTAHVVQLAVIDAVTGGFVELRGDVVSVPHSPVCVSNISCALPEVADADGVVTQHAVLLASLSNNYNVYDQYVSNDGGNTWRKYSTGARGVSHYVGNRLHPAVIGKQL